MFLASNSFKLSMYCIDLNQAGCRSKKPVKLGYGHHSDRVCEIRLSPALQTRDAGVSVKLYQPGTWQETRGAQLVPSGEFNEGAFTKVGG